MTRKDDGLGDPLELRRQAEEKVRRKWTRALEKPEALSPEETQRALYELRVHQIELEMQNEELRRAQVELDAARALYFDLYDLAPVGYLTLSEQGLILESNLTAGGLLGVARGALVRQPITRFIHWEDQDIYYHHHKRLLETGKPQTWGFRMLRAEAASFWAHVEATVGQDAAGAPVCRVVISDITQLKRAEAALDLRARIAVLFASIAGDEMFHEVLKLVLELSESPLGIFGYLDEEGALVVPTMTRQASDECNMSGKTLRFPRETWGDSTWSRTIREKRTICSNEVSTGVPEGHVGIRRHVSLPILFEGEVIGLLVVANRETDYTEADIESLRAIAAHVAPILSARLDARRAQQDLERIKWMLSEQPAQVTESETGGDDQGYGDLTALNRQDGILRALGRETLEGIAGGYLDLLGTSSAIYEASGDYACAIFASGWCRMLDRAARDLCNTPDNAAALASGRWLCHESCWTECSREAIARRAPVDIECHGGLHIYGVPIIAEDEVIGSINVGYGDPPTDPVKLRELAGAYRLDYQDLLREARAYDSRPPFIIEMAKSRLHALARLIGVFVTQRRRSEADREKLQAEFFQAQKLESIGLLAGGVAHDFNNLLNVILGYSDLALRGLKRGDPAVKFLTEVQRAGDKATELTRQLLAFSRKQVLEPRVFDLNSVIAKSASMLHRLIGEDISLVVVPGAGLSRVKADPAQIDQILMNLAVNSRDAMPQGGKLIIETANVELDESFVRLNRGARQGSNVMVTVRDTGVGMDKETQAHLFEPFFTTKEVGKGTGLGLSVVYGILKQSGGYITVHSEPGQGTEFKIYLPRVFEIPEPVLAGEVATIQPGDETILVAEDEPSLRKLVCCFLEEAGYQVLVARGGQEAIQIATQHNGALDLLLTDVVMPDLSGPRLAEQLQPFYPQMKVLYMSGYPDPLKAPSARKAGGKLITKPFTQEKLLRQLREVLEGRKL